LRERGIGRGYPSPQPTMGLEKRLELPRWDPGGDSAQNQFGAFWWPYEAADGKEIKFFSIRFNAEKPYLLTSWVHRLLCAEVT